MDLPIDTSNNRAQAKWSNMLVGLLPDGMAMLDIGGMGGVVDADDHHEQPRQGNEDAIGSK